MPTWGLVVEMTVGTGERKHVEAYVVAHVTGSREEALAELEQRARNFVPAHPVSPKRRRLLREGDTLLLVVDGAWQSYLTRFTVAELLEDSAAPAAPVVPEPIPEPEPEPEPVPEPAPVEDPVERYSDGVPVRPSWLGRDGLS
ncbi:hypothetical protein [Streptomyces sp. CC208A]|uniref:hypothetical protein n=1 Tax=Streptomyces sp. CC208A TaxID=3044573 RepID=UPI0024A84EAE|nr:hypothetical protein [Streptomyces sp. CC208A]